MNFSSLISTPQILISYVLLGVISILRATPKVPNWVIPWIVVILAAAINVSMLGFSTANILVGLVIGFSTSGIHFSFADMSNILTSKNMKAVTITTPPAPTASTSPVSTSATPVTVTTGQTVTDPSQLKSALN